MQEPDRKALWAFSAALLVIIFEIAWVLVGHWLNSAAFWTAFFTGALTLSTIALWVATRQSAKIAERALTDYERPWLFLESVKIVRRQPPPAPNEWYIETEWRNVGRTPAIVEECVIKLLDKPTLPATPDYSNAAHVGLRATFPADATGTTGQIGPGNKLRPNGTAIEYVAFGRVTYRELNGRTHHTGFAVEVWAIAPGFVMLPNKNYEFWD